MTGPDSGETDSITIEVLKHAKVLFDRSSDDEINVDRLVLAGILIVDVTKLLGYPLFPFNVLSVYP